MLSSVPAPAISPTTLRREAFADLPKDHARYALALALAPKRATPAASALPDPTFGTAAGRPPDHYYLPVSDQTVHWGFLSRALPAVISVRSGDVVTIETLTQHASDDAERMIDGDPGADDFSAPLPSDLSGMLRRSPG